MNDLLLYELQKKMTDIQEAMIEMKKKNTEYNTMNISNIYNLQNDVLTIQNTLISINNDISHLQPPYKSYCTYICDNIVVIVSLLFMYCTIIYMLILHK